MSDALKIARFCWPGKEWRIGTVDGTLYWKDGNSFNLDASWNPNDLNEIAVAEAVLIERGLGEEYGMQLFRHTQHTAIEASYDDGRNPGVEADYHDLAMIATAPLDARVRAMVKVIKKEEKKTK